MNGDEQLLKGRATERKSFRSGPEAAPVRPVPRRTCTPDPGELPLSLLRRHALTTDPATAGPWGGVRSASRARPGCARAGPATPGSPHRPQRQPAHRLRLPFSRGRRRFRTDGHCPALKTGRAVSVWLRWRPAPPSGHTFGLLRRASGRPLQAHAPPAPVAVPGSGSQLRGSGGSRTGG